MIRSFVDSFNKPPHVDSEMSGLLVDTTMKSNTSTPSTATTPQRPHPHSPTDSLTMNISLLRFLSRQHVRRDSKESLSRIHSRRASLNITNAETQPHALSRSAVRAVVKGVTCSFHETAASTLKPPFHLRANTAKRSRYEVDDVSHSGDDDETAAFATIHPPLTPVMPKVVAGDDENVLRWHRLLDECASIGTEWRHHPLLRELIYQGIPPAVRARAYALFLMENFEHRDDYVEYYAEMTNFAQTHITPSANDIEKDIHRTLPNHPLFAGNKDAIQSLRRILFAYAHHAPTIGYCQGLNFIAGTLLIVCQCDEALTFALFCCIIDQRMAYYTRSMAGCVVDTAVMQDLAAYYEPELQTLLNKYGMCISNFCSSWLICLYLHSPLRLYDCLRFWDILFLYGEQMQFRMGLAILRAHHTTIIHIDSPEEIMRLFLQDIGHINDFDSVMNHIKVTTEYDTMLELSIQSLREYHQYEVSASMTQLNQTALSRLSHATAFSQDELQKLWELFIQPNSWQTIVKGCISSLTHFRFSFVAAVFKNKQTNMWKGKGLIQTSHDVDDTLMNGLSSEQVQQQQQQMSSDNNNNNYTFPDNQEIYVRPSTASGLTNLSAQFRLPQSQVAAESIFSVSAEKIRMSRTSKSSDSRQSSEHAEDDEGSDSGSDESSVIASAEVLKSPSRLRSFFTATTNTTIPTSPSSAKSTSSLSASLIAVPKTFSLARVLKHASEDNNTPVFASRSQLIPTTIPLSWRKQMRSSSRANSIVATDKSATAFLPLTIQTEFVQRFGNRDDVNDEENNDTPATGLSVTVTSSEECKEQSPAASPASSNDWQSMVIHHEDEPVVRAPLRPSTAHQIRASSRSHDKFDETSERPKTALSRALSTPLWRTASTQMQAASLSGTQTLLRSTWAAAPTNHVRPAAQIAVGGGLNVMARLFTLLDTHSRGYIDFDEFCLGVAIFKKSSQNERIRAVFAMCDSSGNGSISRDELSDLVVMFDRLYHGSRVNMKESESFVNCAFEKVTERTSQTENNNDVEESLSFAQFQQIIVLHPNIAHFFKLTKPSPTA